VCPMLAPSDLSKMEVDGIMAQIGYVRSQLPTASPVYIRQQDRIVVGFDDQGNTPWVDLVRVLIAHGVDGEALPRAYDALYGI